MVPVRVAAYQPARGQSSLQLRLDAANSTDALAGSSTGRHTPPVSTALIVIDVQHGFDDPRWGRRNNPACEQNIARLLSAWHLRGEPLAFVRHDSREPGSPLAPGQPGNALRPEVSGEQLTAATAATIAADFGRVAMTADLL